MSGFRESLPADQRHFAKRLEAFGDIVIGFSLSQLALQLTLPAHAADLFGHPIRFVLFFGTFALVVACWLRMHRIFASAFVPAGVELVMLFAYLGLTALLPFALSANVRYAVNAHDAVYGFALYAGTWAAISATALVLDLFAWQRADRVLDDAQRARLWRAILRGASMVVVTVAALTLDATLGIVLAGWAMVAVAPIMRLTVRLIAVPPRPAGTFALADVS
jgi:uncharacterized membrane protein